MGELGEGTVVQGRYRIEGVLGRGGGGTTYRAARVEDGGGVAVKRLALGDLRDWKLLELAEREARVLSRLEHPAIPRYVEHFVDDGGDGHTFTLVQQLVAARSLRAWREGGWHPRESELQDVAAQVLDVLAYIHALSPPLVHRDIKPENVLRDDDGRIYVVDFGGVRDTVRTATGGSTVVGTFGYMAPEQFRGAATPASDLYGLGATIVYLATGLAPTDLPQKKLRIDFRSRAALGPGLSAWLDRALDPDADERFASAAIAKQALLSPGPAPRRGGGARLAVLVGALGVVVIGGGAFVGIATLRGGRRASERAQPSATAATPTLPERPPTRAGLLAFERQWKAHFSATFDATFTPDSRQVVSTGRDKTVKAWDVPSGSPLRAFVGHEDFASSTAITGDGKTLVTAGDHTIRTWNVATGEPIRTIDAQVPVTRAAVSRDGRRIVAGARDGVARVWNAETGAIVHSFPHAPGKRVGAVAISPDGRTAYTGAADGVIRSWSLESGAAVGTFAGHTKEVDAIAFAPDGQTFVSVGDDHATMLWSAISGQPLRRLAAHDDEAWTTAVSPRGDFFVSGGKDQRLLAFEVMSGTRRDELALQTEATAMAFSPDGAKLVVGTGTGHLQLYSVARKGLATVIPASGPKVPPFVPPVARTPAEAAYLKASAEVDATVMGSLDEAERLVAEGLRADPKSAPLHVVLARAYINRASGEREREKAEMLGKADAELDRALALAPKLPEAHLIRARVAYARDDLPKSKEAVERALALRPDYPMARVHAAMLLRHDGKLVEARDGLARVIEGTRDPIVLGRAYGELNKTYRELGDLDAQRACYEREIELAPGHPWPRSNFAEFLVYMDDDDRAVEMATSALAIQPYASAKRALAEARAARATKLLWDQRRPDDARGELDASLAVYETAEAHYALGAYHQSRGLDPGSVAAARQHYARALAIDPQHRQAKKALDALPR